MTKTSRAPTTVDPRPDAACAPDEHPRRPRVELEEATVTRAAGFFRAIGDEGRLRLLAHLLHGEWCVTDLAVVLGEGLSTVSQRFRLLRAEGLVRRRRAGKHVFYALADEHVATFIENALAHADEPRGK